MYQFRWWRRGTWRYTTLAVLFWWSCGSRCIVSARCLEDVLKAQLRSHRRRCRRHRPWRASQVMRWRVRWTYFSDLKNDMVVVCMYVVVDVCWLNAVLWGVSSINQSQEEKTFSSIFSSCLVSLFPLGGRQVGDEIRGQEGSGHVTSMFYVSRLLMLAIPLFSRVVWWCGVYDWHAVV